MSKHRMVEPSEAADAVIVLAQAATENMEPELARRGSPPNGSGGDDFSGASHADDAETPSPPSTVPSDESAFAGSEVSSGRGAPELVDETGAYLKGLIEALIFVSDHPLEIKDLARAAKIDKKRAGELVQEIKQDYADRGVRLDEVGDGWAFRSDPRYAEYVRGYLALRPVRLSRPQLETLAIVAYRQPITRPEVDDIRGVDAGPVLKGLLERDLIRIIGKKDEPGRPMLYGTTQTFLQVFSLKSLRDLPTLREFTELNDDSRRVFERETGEEAPEGALGALALAEAAEAVADAEGAEVEGAEVEGEDSSDAMAAGPAKPKTPAKAPAKSPATPKAPAKAPPKKEEEEEEGDDEDEDDDDEDDDDEEGEGEEGEGTEGGDDEDDDDDDDDDDEEEEEEED